MKQTTLRIDENLYKKLRIIALQQDLKGGANELINKILKEWISKKEMD